VSKSIAVLQDRADRPVFLRGRMVRRPRQLCSEAVQALLTHLAEVGFVEAPLPGRVSKRWEHQSYLSGVAGDDACRLVDTNKAVAQVGALLRRYHDAVEGWQSERKLTWFDGQTGTGGPGELVCHGDPGPWNLVWRRGKLVGLIDWEYATVGTRRNDVAYALHYLVPFRDRSYWQGVLGLARRPRRWDRMQAFAEGYGMELDDELVEAVFDSQRAGVQRMMELAERGHPRYRQMILDGKLERELGAVRWVEGHRHRFWLTPSYSTTRTILPV
jgi:hypothetical protein